MNTTQRSIIITLFFGILLSVSTIAQQQDTLEIHIIATQADMDSGFFRVEFWESISEPTVRKITTWNPEYYLQFLSPYVVDSIGTTGVVPDGRLQYTLNDTGFVKYGYIIYPTPNESGTGFCNTDLAIIDLAWTFPDDGNYWFWDFDEVIVHFDVPQEMRVYSPWEKVSELDKTFRLWDNDVRLMDNTRSLCVWGKNFTSSDSLEYGNHKFYMLGYKTDTSNIFRLLKFSYEYFMQMYDYGNQEFMPANIVVVLPVSDEGDYKSATEMPGGFYFSNYAGDQWEPVIDYQGYVTKEIGYFNYATNLSWISAVCVHQLAHSMNMNFWDWWSVEGTAVFYQFDILYRIGLFDSDLLMMEWIEHLRYYKEEIVAKSKDSPLTGDNVVSYTGEDQWITGWLAYKKSSLVYYIWDYFLKNASNNNIALIDFWNHFEINQKQEYIPNSWASEKFNDLAIRTLTYLTGKDMQDFFNRYIYGTESLPMEIVGDSIAITWNSPVSLKPNITQPLFISSNNSSRLVVIGEGDSLEVQFLTGQVEDQYLNLTQYSRAADYSSDVPEFEKPLYYLDITVDTPCSTQITIQYSDSILAEKEINEDSLAISYFGGINSEESIWHSIPFEVNKEDNTIFWTTDFMGLWAITSNTEDLITSNEKNDLVPTEFTLHQNYPNPFNPSTIIRYDLPKTEIVSINVYNVTGQLVKRLGNNELKTAGIHQLEFNATDLASGVYFCTIKAGKQSRTIKLNLMK